MLVVHVLVSQLLPDVALAGALAPVQFSTNALFVVAAQVSLVQLLPDPAGAGALAPVQNRTAVGPVLLLEHVVVVFELPGLGDTGVQVCTGVGPVVIGVFATDEQVVAV